jgi:hypothetical protein
MIDSHPECDAAATAFVATHPVLAALPLPGQPDVECAGRMIPRQIRDPQKTVDGTSMMVQIWGCHVNEELAAVRNILLGGSGESLRPPRFIAQPRHFVHRCEQPIFPA